MEDRKKILWKILQYVEIFERNSHLIKDPDLISLASLFTTKQFLKKINEATMRTSSYSNNELKEVKEQEDYKAIFLTTFRYLWPDKLNLKLGS